MSKIKIPEPFFSPLSTSQSASTIGGNSPLGPRSPQLSTGKVTALLNEKKWPNLEKMRNNFVNGFLHTEPNLKKKGAKRAPSLPYLSKSSTKQFRKK